MSENVADFEVGDEIGEMAIVGEEVPDDVERGADEIVGTHAAFVACGSFDEDADFCGGVIQRLGFVAVETEEGHGSCGAGEGGNG